jgi:hypothetical protein
MVSGIAAYALAYFISVVGGYFVLLAIMSLIRKTTRQPMKHRAIDFWVGGTERAVATTLVIIAPPYVGLFIGAWVALKMAANWQRRESSDLVRTATMTALLGSVFSFAVAICAGLLVNPGALAVWATK